MPSAALSELRGEGLRRGALGDRGKSRRVGEGDVGQHLAVELHLGLLQAGDEPRVRHARHASGGVDAGDPQRAEVATADAAPARGLHQRALNRLDGALVAVVPAAAEPAGELEHAVAAAACLETSLDAHCYDSPSGNLLRQPVWQGLLEMSLVAAVEDLGAAQMTLALAVLSQGKVVAPVGLAGLDHARPRGGEPL